MSIKRKILTVQIVGVFLLAAFLGLLIGATVYSKDYGVVAFKYGGYMVFKPAEGTYLPLRYDIRWHEEILRKRFDITESIEIESCDLDCFENNQSSGIFGISSAQDKELPNACKTKSDQNISHEFSSSKPLLACLSVAPTHKVLTVYFTVVPSKQGVLVMGSSSTISGYDPEFIDHNKRYLVDIINSARYEPSLWKALLNL